jgi:hypothetical protein
LARTPTTATGKMMKQLCALFIYLIVGNPAYSQSDATYFFKEVGMSIQVSKRFETVAFSDDEELRRKGEKLLEEANDVQIDASSTKNLLSIRQGQFIQDC